MNKQTVYGILGLLGFVICVGIVGGIEHGAPLGNFVYAFASIIGSGYAFYKGGLMK